MIAAFDALGIAQAPVYGSHTGAAIAVAAALSHPGRVTALALDGYAMFTPTEQAEFLGTYLQPIRPEWDGAWLTWLWGRVKDQFSFFPWYLRADSARIARPLPPPTILQSVIVDFLAAGDAYRPGYAAAFRFPGLASLQQLAVACVVMARSDDLLFTHLDALTELPDCVTVQRLPPDDAAWAASVASGTIGVARHGTGVKRPIVLLPPIPGSAQGCVDLARALSRDRVVLTVDLPGFGASALSGPLVSVAIAQAIAVAVGVAAFDVVACGESAAIGCALAGDGRLVLLDPVPDTERDAVANAMVDVTARPDGGHLLAAWHQLRDARLWRPWFLRDPAHAIACGTDADASSLHATLTDWMRGGTAGHATLRAVLGPPLAGLIPRDAVVITAPGHPWAGGRELDGALRTRAAAILDALG